MHTSHSVGRILGGNALKPEEESGCGPPVRTALELESWTSASLGGPPTSATPALPGSHIPPRRVALGPAAAAPPGQLHSSGSIPRPGPAPRVPNPPRPTPSVPQPRGLPALTAPGHSPSASCVLTQHRPARSRETTAVALRFRCGYEAWCCSRRGGGRTTEGRGRGFFFLHAFAHSFILPPIHRPKVFSEKLTKANAV